MINIIIVVLPAISRRGRRLYGRYDAYHRGQFVCRSAAPLLASARVLLHRGEDPTATIGMVHASAPHIITLTASIGTAAKFDVVNDHFVRRGQKAICGSIFGAPVRHLASLAPSPTLEPERALAGSAP